MQIQPDEIAWILEQEIANYRDVTAVEPYGRVIKVGDGIAQIWGLDQVMMSEIVGFSDGTPGMVLNLEAGSIGVIILGSDENIKERDIVKRTHKLASVPVGEHLLGRIIDPLGNPLDGKGPIEKTASRLIEWPAPDVIQRQPVHEPLETGIKAIDALIPIGLGQRELIIGDRQTGKTTLIIDTIINQKNKGIHCIYNAIGQKASTVAHTAALFQEEGAFEYTTIVAAPASSPAALQYLAPYAATALGEYYMYQGKHAVCFYDDLTKHAQAYRQISLLLRRPPGREAYPGDVFYLHSRLLERSAKLNDELGGGSLTALPVIETQAGDVASYIPTNVISITDGQIFLEADLFYAGIRPAINVSLSASRVGGNAQTNAMKAVAQSLRLDLAQYRELAAFAQFGSELDDSTKAQLTRGERVVEILKQDKFKPESLSDEVISIFLAVKGILDDLPLQEVKGFKESFLKEIQEKHPEIPRQIEEKKELSKKHMEELENIGWNFKKEKEHSWHP